MMKQLTFLLTGFFLLLTVACSDDTGIPRTLTSIDVEYPEGVSSLTIVSQSITFKNLTTGETLVFNSAAEVSVPEGIYDCTYTAEVTYTNGEDAASLTDNEDLASKSVTQEGYLSGKEENVIVQGDAQTITVKAYLSTNTDDFIFEEIFFTGTLRPSGSQYYGDSYFKIYNNTDHVLYADGLAFCESKFKSTKNSMWSEYDPWIREDTFTVWSIYVIPGDGTEHPVLPGHSLLICDTGIDHRVANENSFDLSAADFEWYDVSTKPNYMDIDSETVPNLDKWYCYTLSFYVLHNRGFSSFALARIPKEISKEQYLKDYWYSYSYTMYLDAGTFYMTQSAYKIPNTWIVDGVNCSVEASRVWNILPPSIDAGWTHCGTIDHDKTRYFKSVRRKCLYLNADGTRHLKDTNNSTEDFNTECVPSVIEEQGTAIWSDGTKATTKTYDGVWVKEE